MAVSETLYKSFYWKIVHFLFSFLITVSLAHILKPAISSAFYSLVYSFSLISIIFTLGLDISLNYFITKKEITPQGSALCILILTFVAILVSIPSIYYFYNPSSATIINKKEIAFLAGLQIGGTLLTILCGSVLTALQKNHVATKITVIFSIIVLLAILTVNRYYANLYSAKYIFYLWFIFTSIQGIFFFIYTFSRYTIANPRLFFPIKKILRFSLFVFIINLTFTLGGKIPVLILPYQVSAYEAGNYIQAYKLLEYMNTIVAFIYLPVVAISARQKGKPEETVLFLVRIFNTGAIILCSITVLFGQFLFPFIFGKEFASMYMVSLCLIPALITTCSSAFFTAFFFGKGLLRYNLLSAAVLLISLMILFFPLTHYLSIEGTALAFSLASLISLMVDIFLFRKLFRCNATDLLFATAGDIKTLRLFISKKRQLEIF